MMSNSELLFAQIRSLNKDVCCIRPQRGSRVAVEESCIVARMSHEKEIQTVSRRSKLPRPYLAYKFS